MTPPRGRASEWDVVIVGAGAAGLSAAIMLAHAKRRVVLIGNSTRRNSPATGVYNVAFAEGVPPSRLYAQMEQTAAVYGVTIMRDWARAASVSHDRFLISTASGGVVEAPRVLLATGYADTLPEWLPEGAWGSVAFSCPYCHTAEHDGEDFVAVGEGDGAVMLGTLSAQFARTLTAVVKDPAAASGRHAHRLAELGGRVCVDTIRSASLRSGGGIRLNTVAGQVFDAGAVLLSGVNRPSTALVEDLGLDCDEQGVPVTTELGRTSHPHVWRAGNITESAFMWTGAASSGLNAARSINENIAFGDSWPWPDR